MMLKRCNESVTARSGGVTVDQKSFSQEVLVKQ
jgi:hypothetical protein